MVSSEHFFECSDFRIFLREGSMAVSSEYFYVIVNFCRQNIFERGFHGGVVRILSPLLIHHLTHELSYALRFHNKL